MTAPPFLTGQTLLAMPGIGDARFARTVIAMCAHDAEGAMGIDIGHVVTGIGLHAVLRQLDIDPGEAPDAPVLRGGPVEEQRGFILHSRDWAGAGTIDVAGRWNLSASIDGLRAIAEGRGPSRWVVALGYAGWGEGQLDGELIRHGWFSADVDQSALWAAPAADRWDAAFRATGVDPRLLVGATGTA